MAKFEFPRNPGTEAKHAFTDDDGSNPFSDAGSKPQAAEANPFSSPTAESSYVATEYETQLADRSGQVFFWGVIGLMLSLLGIFAAVLCVAGSGWAWGLFYALPIQCVSLAISFPAWTMGHRDSVAISSKAMEDCGKSRTAAGLRMGQLAVALSLLPVALLASFLVWQIVAG
jgi:hypothetical protein